MTQLPRRFDVNACVREWEIDLIFHWLATTYESAFLEQLLGRIVPQAGGNIPMQGAQLIDIVLHKNEGTGTAWGENDIRCVVQCGEKRVVLLIETKIEATFTQRQPDRYQERCSQLRSGGDCDDAWCILLAPERYLARQTSKLFDAYLSFEALEAILSKLPVIPSQDHIRSAYRQIVKHASQQEYTQTTDPVVGDFWDQYRQVAALRYPGLVLKTRQGGSRQSKDVYFVNSMRRWNVKHRLDREQGMVAIELYHWGPLIGVVRDALSDILLPGMTVHPPPRGRKQQGVPVSVQISIPVPTLNTLEPFERQLDAVLAGLDVVQQVMKWIEAHQERITRLNGIFEASRRKQAGATEAG